MRRSNSPLVSLAILFAIQACLSLCVYAQGTTTDYERANALKARYEAAAVDIAGPATWIGNTHRFWYRKLSRGTNEFIIFDADTLQKQSAFDHSKIAASLSKLTGTTYKPQDLSLTGLRFDGNGSTFFATIDGTAIRCTIADSACTKVEIPARGPQQRQGPFPSPDGKWEAVINNYNLVVRSLASKEVVLVSTDGSEGN